MTFDLSNSRGVIDLPTGAGKTRDTIRVLIDEAHYVPFRKGSPIGHFGVGVKSAYFKDAHRGLERDLRLRFGSPAPEKQETRAHHAGRLTYKSVRETRGEQSHLRELLLRRGSSCGLCGRVLPRDLLVAAHIKRREHCSDTERRDLHNVAMLACKLGCDDLFEKGYIAVGRSGKTLIDRMKLQPYPELAGLVASRLEGRRVPAWTPERGRYFAWHRRHVFTGDC